MTIRMPPLNTVFRSAEVKIGGVMKKSQRLRGKRLLCISNNPNGKNTDVPRLGKQEKTLFSQNGGQPPAGPRNLRARILNGDEFPRKHNKIRFRGPEGGRTLPFSRRPHFRHPRGVFLRVQSPGKAQITDAGRKEASVHNEPRPFHGFAVWIRR